MPKTNLLIVFVLLSAMTKAQKPILFKFKYLPSHTYEITAKDGLSTEIGMQNLTATAEKKADTTTTTINTATNTECSTTLKTDAAAAESFPVTILSNAYSTKMTLNGTEVPGPGTGMLKGLPIKGKIDVTGNLFLDPATVSKEIDSAAALLKAGMPKPLIFPDKPMKIGDTFVREFNKTGINLDLGFDMEYPVKITYQLTAVKDKVAYFDMTSEFKMSEDKEVQGKTVHINGKGNGTGKMEFYIDKGYPKSIVDNVDCLLEFKGPNTRIVIKLMVSKDAKYTVKAN